MSSPSDFIGPIGRDPDCIVCGMVRTSDSMEGRPGHTTPNAVISCCVATLEACDRLGLDRMLKELCPPCREAFQTLAAKCRS